MQLAIAIFSTQKNLQQKKGDLMRFWGGF